ncbi:hypothetical protein HD806DRAFT_494308 [Xylariaceae sp. AK1471]|nr:hypothetical protein HD806DRAFT_494308 [Xylariaceae sp. AK1471]
MGAATLPPPDVVAWQLSHSRDSLVNVIIATSSICGPLAVLWVALRIWSRRLLHGRYSLDISDWLNVAALFLFIPFEIIFAVATRYGVGRHAVLVTNPRLLQILYLTEENLYSATLCLLKLSIISFYRKIFKCTVWFNRATWVVGFVVVSLATWSVIATNLQCIPIEATWNPFIKAKCINFGLSALLAYVVNILTDITILSLPIPLVMRLNTSRQRKRGLILSFVAGGSACIVSIVQLRYVSSLGSTTDPSWDNTPAAIISSVECMVGFLATSVATYRPLYRCLSRGELMSIEASHPADRNVCDSNGKSSYAAHISAGGNCQLQNVTANLSGGITATDQIELVRHVNRGGVWVKVDDEPDNSELDDGSNHQDCFPSCP